MIGAIEFVDSDNKLISATKKEESLSVSYTHLDVYKREVLADSLAKINHKVQVINE